MTLRDGKPCKRCGTSEWYKYGKCKVCKSANDRKYRETHRLELSERKRKYREENKEIVAAGIKSWVERNGDRKKELDHKWAKANPDKIKRNHKKWRENNKDKTRARSKKWREDNPDRVLEQEREWRLNNPEKSRARVIRRRARKRNAKHEPYLFSKICEKYGNVCLCCGSDSVPLTIDHVIPLSRDGDDIESNIQPLCKKCNSAKGTKTIDFRIHVIQRMNSE